MFSSNDNKIRVNLVKDYNSLAFPPTDFSVWHCPDTLDQFMALMKALSDSPTDNHIALITCGGKISQIAEQLSFIKNIAGFKKLELNEVLCIQYGATSVRNGSGLSKISEHAFIVSKGRKPNIQQTSWFQPNKNNSTNFWDTSPYGHLETYANNQQGMLREPVTITTLGKFCWDIGYLMSSLATPFQYKSVLTNYNPLDLSLLSFVKCLGLTLNVYTNKQDSVQSALETYNEYSHKDK